MTHRFTAHLAHLGFIIGALGACGDDSELPVDGTTESGTSGDGDGDGDGDPGDGDGDPGDGDGDPGDGDGDPGDGDGDGDPGEVPGAAVLELNLAPVKHFEFSWAPVEGAQYYQLHERLDAEGEFVQTGEDIEGTAVTLTVPLVFRVNASYLLRSCNEWGCSDSVPLAVSGSLAEAVGYFKASNTNAGDLFGYGVALSGDGDTLVVGAVDEDSGNGGNEGSNSVSDSGAVYVFERVGDAWSQEAYIKASNPGEGDFFAHRLALSHDGATILAGACWEGGSGTGVNPTPDDAAENAGAIYVFARTNSGWVEQAYIKASNTEANEQFGCRPALSADGQTIASGAVLEDSSATGINGDQGDNGAQDSGAVYVYMRSNDIWSQQAYIKASNTGATDRFGVSVSLSGDGDRLAVGALYEDSAANGINGAESDNILSNAGAAYVFERDDNDSWSQHSYIKASNPGESDIFGIEVELSADGDTLAVGARYEDSAAPGVGGDQDNNGTGNAGAVYVYSYINNAWSQEAYVKASNPGPDYFFGLSIALSDDGDVMAVSSDGEAGAAIGIGGDQANAGLTNAGAVYVFTRAPNHSWSQRAYVKAPHTGEGDALGIGVALSADGQTLAIGAPHEDSASTGIHGDQSDDTAPDAGAVYLY